MREPQRKAEDGNQQEERHQDAERRGDKLPLLADHQLEEPDKKERAQCQVEKGWLEADGKGKAGKRQQEDDAAEGDKAPVRIGQDEHRRNQGRRSYQRQQRAGNADKERNQQRPGNQYGAKRHPSHELVGRKKDVLGAAIGALQDRHCQSIYRIGSARTNGAHLNVPGTLL